MNKHLITLIFLSLLSFQAQSKPLDIWEKASRFSGVPVKYIKSMCIAESGIAFTDGVRRAWPYTLNSKKGPMYFKTKREAAQVLSLLIKEGLTNIDIGICQVNMTYHADKATPFELLDPVKNVHATSLYLKQLMQIHNNDLAKVIASYHTGSLITNEQLTRGSNYVNNINTIRMRML